MAPLDCSCIQVTTWAGSQGQEGQFISRAGPRYNSHNTRSVFVAVRKGGKGTTVTGHKVLSEVRSLGGSVLGLALKTMCPINLKAFMGQQLAFCRHFVQEGEGGRGAGVGGASVWSTYHDKKENLATQAQALKLVMVT